MKPSGFQSSGRALCGPVLGLIATVSSTALLGGEIFSESFNYPDGELAATSGGHWTAYNVAGSNPILVSDASLNLNGGVAGSRYLANRPLGGSYANGVAENPLNSGFLTYSFTLDFSAGVPPVAGSQALFISLLDSHANPRAQLRLLAPISSGFRLGLEADQDQNIPTAAVTGDLSSGVHTVTVRYSLQNPGGDSLAASLWVDSATSGPPTVVDTVSSPLTGPITDLGLRQFTVAYSGLRLDGLSVQFTGVPEPATYAQTASLALVGWALFRRKAAIGRPTEQRPEYSPDGDRNAGRSDP